MRTLAIKPWITVLKTDLLRQAKKRKKVHQSRDSPQTQLSSSPSCSTDVSDVHNYAPYQERVSIVLSFLFCFICVKRETCKNSNRPTAQQQQGYLRNARPKDIITEENVP